MFNREIFRKKALEKLSTPDDLDELLQVNSRLSWILLLSLLCLILGGVVWVVFGQIVNKVVMIGIIQPVNPPRLLMVSESGQVDSIFHQTGDSVFKGQPIVRYIPENTNIAKYILSPCNGELVELDIRQGVFLLPGTIVAKIGSFHREQLLHPEFLFFVSDKKVSNLAIGQNVNILIKLHEPESLRLSTQIRYIGKIPLSDESIDNIIPDKEVGAQLKKGNYYLVRTDYIPALGKTDPFKSLSANDFYGKVLNGEAVISQDSPIAYLLAPSK
jgi:hypothetical protein